MCRSWLYTYNGVEIKVSYTEHKDIRLFVDGVCVDKAEDFFGASVSHTLGSGEKISAELTGFWAVGCSVQIGDKKISPKELTMIKEKNDVE